jgi:hypothetical protein
MDRYRRSSLVWVGLCAGTATLAASPGCEGGAAPTPDPNGIPEHGQYVTLYHDPGQAPCAGTLPYLDATAGAIASYLGIPIKAPIPYYYTPSLLACPSNEDLGCELQYNNGSVACVARLPAVTHELVHAIQNSDGPSFLLEGQAVALGQRQWLDVSDQAATDGALLSPTQIQATDYPLAGDFVSYLLTRFGAAPFERTLASLHAGTTVDQIESAFAQNYAGKTMADLRTERAASSNTFFADRIDLSECIAMAPDNRLGQMGTVDEIVDCASNAYGAPGVQANSDIPFDIAVAGLYTLMVAPPKGGSLTLETCGGGRVLEISDTIEPDAITVGYLHAGRYAFILHALTSAPSTFTLGVQPLLMAEAPACASIPAVQVPAGTKHIYLFSMDDRSFEVPFVLTSPATLTGEQLSSLSSTALCSGGCGLGCQPSVPLVPQATLPAGATFSLQATLIGQPDLIGESLN